MFDTDVETDVLADDQFSAIGKILVSALTQAKGDARHKQEEPLEVRLIINGGDVDVDIAFDVQVGLSKEDQAEMEAVIKSLSADPSSPFYRLVEERRHENRADKNELKELLNANH